MDNQRVIDTGALRYLKQMRPELTLQQFRTIKGQILAGDSEGARRGLERLLKERRADNG